MEEGQTWEMGLRGKREQLSRHFPFQTTCNKNTRMGREMRNSPCEDSSVGIAQRAVSQNCTLRPLRTKVSHSDLLRCEACVPEPDIHPINLNTTERERVRVAFALSLLRSHFPLEKGRKVKGQKKKCRVSLSSSYLARGQIGGPPMSASAGEEGYFWPSEETSSLTPQQPFFFFSFFGHRSGVHLDHRGGNIASCTTVVIVVVFALSLRPHTVAVVVTAAVPLHHWFTLCW